MTVHKLFCYEIFDIDQVGGVINFGAIFFSNFHERGSLSCNLEYRWCTWLPSYFSYINVCCGNVLKRTKQIQTIAGQCRHYERGSCLFFFIYKYSLTHPNISRERMRVFFGASSSDCCNSIFRLCAKRPKPLECWNLKHFRNFHC